MDFEVYLNEETGEYRLYRAGSSIPEGLAYIGTATVTYKASTEQYLKEMER